MADPHYQEFFTQPHQAYHRQYEALRAVFVDGRSQKEVAEAFGYAYDSFRQLVRQFRRACDGQGPSPFFEMFR